MINTHIFLCCTVMLTTSSRKKEAKNLIAISSNGRIHEHAKSYHKLLKINDIRIVFAQLNEILNISCMHSVF